MAANPKIYIFMLKKGKISMISKCKHCNRFKGQNFPPASKQQINITQCFLGTFRNPAL